MCAGSPIAETSSSFPWPRNDEFETNSEHPTVTAKVERYVEIQRQLKAEPRGPRRTALVRESFALRTAPLDGSAPDARRRPWERR